MKLSLTFRRAVSTDIDFLLLLRKSAMVEHLNKAGFIFSDEDHLARVNEFFNDSFIILNDNSNIGLIKLGLFSNRIHIRQFQILPSFQRMGVGNYALDVVKKKARQLQLPITLNVFLENPAKSLYIKHGFYVKEQGPLEYKMCWDSF